MDKNLNLGDITKIKGIKLPYCDIWIGGFPCQDISSAGRMIGFSYESKTRSSLGWEIIRLLKEINEKPKCVIFENVANITNKKYENTLIAFKEELSKLGYRLYDSILNASDYGIPQNRKRYFLVALKNNNKFVFPEKMKSNISLIDYIDNKVEEKYTEDDLLSKLKYLGINKEKIPEYLKDFSPISFNTTRLNNDKVHRVFQFVPIDKIQILLTPCLRGDDIKDKYSKAVPLGRFFNPAGNEEDIERFATLLKIFTKLSIPEVENVATIQKELEKTEPFRVKYNKDHLWQIYYSEATDSYFMLVCTKEETFAEFFYLLKKKIEFAENKRTKVAPRIFVPINYMNYSGEYLTRDEITDIENYLWLFTKNWPLIFEVYDKNRKMSLEVIGDTFVYKNVKSTYKIKLTNAEEAIKFYKLLKALFIMQTEIKDHFRFTTKIDSKNCLELYMGKIRVSYDNLEEFIRSEYLIATEEMKNQSKDCKELEDKLSKLQKKAKNKEKEYFDKQKEISTYLEYKKTFFGKVKVFFKGTKIAKVKENIENKESSEENVKGQKKSEIISVEPFLKEKNYYTLEDLVTVYHIKEKNDRQIKNIMQDIKAISLKIENLTNKVKNATLYINEIDKHRKSIFDFWKFANKDEKLSLEMGNTENKIQGNTQIKKAFDL